MRMLLGQRLPGKRKVLTPSERGVCVKKGGWGQSGYSG